MSAKKPVAFFDIDGTVFRSSLLIDMVDALIEEGIFPKNTSDSYQKEFHTWLNREGTYEAYIMAVVRVYIHHLKGVSYSDFEKIGERVVEREGKKTYRYTRDLVKELTKEGYHIVAISQSPKVILDHFCKMHGFHEVYGRMYEVDENNRFTSNVMHIEKMVDKANIVKRVLEKGLVTCVGSIGVGDTEGDISLLESVERPICFNPNLLLYTHAKENGWKVVVERKDVIYHL